MSEILWRGYPVAQYQGNEAAQYHGHHLEIVQVWIWKGWRWSSEYDAFVDDECVAPRMITRAGAKKMCIAYTDKLEDCHGQAQETHTAETDVPGTDRSPGGGTSDPAP